MLLVFTEYCYILKACYITSRKDIYTVSHALSLSQLFICIEGAKERAIQLAKMELKRMIKEELNKAQMFSFGSGSRTAGGRYNVL